MIALAPRDRVALNATQDQIHHRCVKNLTINQNVRLTDLGSSRDGLTVEISQHIFNHHHDRHFVLDDQDAATGKQFVHGARS